MDEFASALTLAHVVLAFALVAGLIGRWILLTRAAAADDVERAHMLAEAAGPFEAFVRRFALAVIVGLMVLKPF